MVAASAGVLLARRPGAMSKTTVTALQAMGYGLSGNGWKWMEMGNSSPSVAQLKDCVLCPEILARPLSRCFAGAGCIVLR